MLQKATDLGVRSTQHVDRLIESNANITEGRVLFEFPHCHPDRLQ